MSISPDHASCADDHADPLLRAWERDVLHDLLSPVDSVLELPAGQCWLTSTLAARVGWVTVIETDTAHLGGLQEHVSMCGWPNITLASRLAAPGEPPPFDVVVSPWRASDLPSLRRLCHLTQRRVILHGSLADAALDELRTSAQALGLDIKLETRALADGGHRAVLALGTGQFDGR